MLIELEQVQRMMDWFRKKLYLETIVPKARTRLVKRGQVYKCDFGRGIGSEMRKERPAIIVQNDIGNQHSGNTIVVPVTHNDHQSPCIISLTPRLTSEGELLLDGQANASNIMCVSKARLGDFITTLSSEEMKRIDEAMAKSLGIMSYYANMKKKLDDKIEYCLRLKKERNDAQDEVVKLKNEVCLQKR